MGPRHILLILALASMALAGCKRARTLPEPVEDWSADLSRTALVVDVADQTGTATIGFSAPDAGGLSLEVGGLEVLAVRDALGRLRYDVSDGMLHIGIPEETSEVEVDYAYPLTEGWDGVNERGFTLTWPYYCGNVFPCRSHPADGLVLDLELTGVDPALVAIGEGSTVGEAPSYQLAWTIDEYAWVELGITEAGTTVGTWVLPGDEEDAAEGTAPLLDGFAWFEDNLGPYPFGDRVSSVNVNWGPYTGGMEHHPNWFASHVVAEDPVLHLHEAAHGWFGGGVRLRCWEDFVMSEGTATWLAAHVVGETLGQAAEDAVWADYEAKLEQAIAADDHAAWPTTCNEIDILEDLFSFIPYMKGAFFYKAVADEVGEAALIAALAAFFQEYSGEAAGMGDVLDAIQAETGFDPTALSEEWLR